MKFYLKWTNKYSGEIGYVEKISPKNECFYNCEKAKDARRFRSEKEALKAIENLKAFGEADNNDFEIISEK